MSKKWPYRKNFSKLRDYHQAIGIVASEWTVAELQIQVLIWFYLKTDTFRAASVTPEMSNATKTHALTTLVHHFEKDQNKKEAIYHALKFFNTCRENRNILMHWSANSASSSPKVTLMKMSARGEIKYSAILAPLKTVRQVAGDIISLTDYLQSLKDFYDLEENGQKPSLPDKPPLPDKIVNNLHQFGQDEIFPPESSRV